MASKYGRTARSSAFQWFAHRITGTFLIFLLTAHFWIQHYDRTTASISHDVVTAEEAEAGVLPGYSTEAAAAVARQRAALDGREAPVIGSAEGETEAGVPTVIEVPLGRDGIVLAQGSGSAPMSLEPADVFRALAARLPSGPDDCRLLPNRHRSWHEIRADLPERRIAVYGPPKTSGTLEVFVREAIASGARAEPCLAALERSDPDAFAEALQLRADGAWIEAGENDGATAYALTRLPGSIGVFGLVHAAPQEGLTLLSFGGVHPNARTVADGRYPLARPLFLYTTAGHLTRDPRVIEMVRGFTAQETVGPSGLLTSMGLAPGTETGRARLIDSRTGEATPLPLGR